ncbi:MAG: UbiA family prenyltransferase [Candidatus Eremiobacteraeota bacterium]|nr:UbiA family prenyltransferase [Candidatus Eremiobacteraeota bacterium]MBC5804550.1 UbiA family prenyltransferase [Candidatus Eremiobacteraeota bacterium]MBC5820843.1 UbiA family prenyltransferase [Candidatus Eremiobacteraeota bacterium]
MSVSRARSSAALLALVLREIRVAHTLFALPFAYAGAVLAARGLPTVYQTVWITVAVLGARTAAMAANRYFDRDIDARNPRTARRALANGSLAPATMLITTVLGLAVLVIAAAALNPLCVRLLPLAALGIVAYPFCKRYTWGVHFVLGAVDGLAPLGAYIAVSGTVAWPAALMFVAVTVWVAGFDIIYALMDREVDVAQNLRSIPARFGVRSGRVMPLALHLLMAALLAGAGVLSAVGPLYYAGVCAALGLTLYENRLFASAKNLFVLNEDVFVANMVFSIAFMVTTYGGFAWR